MKLSKYFFHSLKEAPGDADIESQKLFTRANFIKKLAPGIYTYMPMGLRVLRKFENIVREEMNRAGAVEILMPMVQPRELWEETDRWQIMGKGLMRMKDRNEHEFCLGATHEEVVTDVARREIKSYRDLPVNLYQIQTKYRDEIRPSFGLMRGKEFVMKDAYSFDVSKEKAMESYWQMYKTYQKIFSRCGLDFRIVKADAGAIGGSLTHEFQVLAQSGEDLIMACDKCDYASNIEITPSLSDEQKPKSEVLLDSVQKAITSSDNFELLEAQGLKIYASKKHLEKLRGFKFKEDKLKIHSDRGFGVLFTPGLKTIEALSEFTKIPPTSLVKTLFYKLETKELVCVLLRGSDELNETKLKNILGLSTVPELASEDIVLELTGAAPGSCGPLGLTREINIIVDHKLKNSNLSWLTGANLDHFHIFGLRPERDFKVHIWGDLAKAQAGDLCPDCQMEKRSGRLGAHRGIEVGHVFYLGDKYSKAMKAQFLDEKGESKYCEMGCYGIGVGRTVQAAIEQSHDKDGMVWPLALAPFHVHICLIDVGDSQAKSIAEDIYNQLISKGVEVLLDDRDERPGSKFKDADLIGIPLRVNVGVRSLQESGSVELVVRKSKEVTKVKSNECVEQIITWIKKVDVKS